MFRQWQPYVPVAERRRKAALEMAKLSKAGRMVSPVTITGRAIVTTAWGKAWCDNLERYSDFSNRLPRGRTYVRNGSVVDLQISAGKVDARVSGSSIYRTSVTVTPMPRARWTTLCGECAGSVDSLVELLQGRFAAGVMERLCRAGDGLFPAPREIRLSCSCPDGAAMCKHVAAVMYGIGARLDHEPRLLFVLRHVDASDLLAKAGAGLAIGRAPSSKRTLAADDVGSLFGLEMDQGSAPRKKSPSSIEAVPEARGASASAASGRGRVTGVMPSEPARPVRAVALFDALRILLRRQGMLTSAIAQQATGKSAPVLRPILRRLVADGHARIEGQARGTRYLAIR